MVRIFRAVSLIVVLGAITAAEAAAQGATAKIAYIKSQTILAQTPQRDAIAAQMQKEMAPAEARMKIINDSNVAMIDAYAKAEPTLSAEDRLRRQKEISDKQTIWSAQADSIRATAEQLQAALEAPMIDLLRTILSDIRAESGYWVIYDVDTPGHGIVAIDRNLEITDRVLARFKVAAASLPKPDSGRALLGAPVPGAAGVTRKIPPPQ